MSNTVRIDAGNGHAIELDRDDPAPVESAAAEIARLEGDEIATGPIGAAPTSTTTPTGCSTGSP